ncbi:hypothetical protein C0V82_09620 [Niveispirillum cyanobacteriorum]|uniref:Uncharacterized protein n=2 Tax=Niveispirillum cyanobacteriorum TaxID=1612173 RepID=A0A2K9NBL3_9PROT|nr:hypothetical protein C0V82_09620 [Niveispirillum cyanobacteriorum]GGE54326.1 hypothetical protein GCM10011317_10690 [Niveispirillum cyanobacteriorum]
MENYGLPRRDPSLWGVFGMCTLLAPVAGAAALLGALIAVALGLPKDAMMVSVWGCMAVLTLPAWAWLFHLYLRGHWRLQMEG